MLIKRVRTSTSVRTVSVVAAMAILASLSGTFAPPAAAAAVLAADTQQSGAGYGFGRNDVGQVNPGATANQLGAKQLPAGGGGLLKDAVSFAVGNGFVIWADHLGRVWSLGDNGAGQKGNGTTTPSTTPTQALVFGGSGQPRAVKVTAYGLAVDVLDSNGDVWQWGQVVNNQSSLVIQSTPNKLPFPSGAARIIDVSAGSNFSVALDANYKAYSWGKNDRGQLGTGATSTSPYPTAVGTGVNKLPAVVPAGAQAHLEAGRSFAAYALSRGTAVDVYTWGANDANQLGNNGASKNSDQTSPAKVASLAAPVGTTGFKVLSLSAGGTHTLLLTNDGVTRRWGSDGIAVAKVPTVVTSSLLSGTHHPYTVSAGDGASFVANTDGTVVAWGTDTTGQLGRTATGTVSTPTLITIPGTSPPTLTGPPVQIVSRQGTTAALVDAEIARSPDQAGYAFPAFSTNPHTSQSAPTHQVTLTNVATRTLTLAQALYVDGAHPNDFLLSGSTCGATLAVDATCSVTVTFRPQATGARQAALVLRTTNTLGGVALSYLVPLSGVGYTAVTGLSGYRLDLAAGSPATVSGRGNRIPIGNLDPVLIPEVVPPVGAATLGKIPLPTLGKITLGKITLGKITLGKITLGKIGPQDTTLGKITLGKITLGKIGLPTLGKITLGKITLGKITLGKIPLLAQGGWEEFLKDYPELAGIPISSMTLEPVMEQGAVGSVAAPRDRITLGDIDLANSALSQVSFLALLAGTTRLSQYPVDWCSELAPFESPAQCTGTGLQRTLLDLSLGHGYPMEAFKATALTLGQVTPLTAGGDPWAGAVWPQVRLDSDGLTLAGTHFDVPLTSIPAANRNLILDCSRMSCSDLSGVTLGSASVRFLPTASFGDLGPVLSTMKIAWLVEPFLDRSAFPWEGLPREAIPLGAYPNRLTLQADVDINCLEASATRFSFTLPGGYDYVPGTAALVKTRGTGTVPLADPVEPSASRIEVAVPDSSFSSNGPIDCTNDSGHLTVRIGVLPGDSAATGQKATGDVSTGTLSASGTQATGVSTTGLYNPPGTSTDGPLGAVDELILGEITTAGGVQYVPIDVPPGKNVEVTASQLGADIDLVLYHPVGAALDPVLSGNTEPLPVPFGESAFPESDNSRPHTNASGGALQDVPLLSGRVVAAVSAMRGTEDEQLSTVSRTGSNDGQRYLVQVSGFNGAKGRFTVRARVTSPQTLGICTVTPPTVGAAPTSAFYSKADTPPVTGMGPDDDTLVLVNRSRLEAYFPGQSQALLDAAYDYTHLGGGVKGQVLQVDSDAAVRAAYSMWDQAPCSPDASNEVGRAINTFQFGKVPDAAHKVRYVVLVGGHSILPHLLPIDTTRDGNEREEAGDLAFTGSNPLANAFAGGRYAIDTPYGTPRPVSVLGQVLYIPQRVLGRVAGESPTAMIGQFANFRAAGGRADTGETPRQAVVTDYDFLTSGGDSVATSLAAAGFSVTHDLTGSRLWSRADLESEWLGRSPVSNVGVLNMHYDQYRALPAQGNATNDLSDLYQAQDVADGPSLLNRVVLTVGCHSALDVPDEYSDPNDPATVVRTKDWAQRYGEKGLAVMVGNLGFGFADTTVLAYSARLQANLATGLADGYDLGTALMTAQHDYVRGMISMSPYDLKSVQQMVLWGLPQYRLTDAPAVQPAAAAAMAATAAVTDPATGLPAHKIAVDTRFRAKTDQTGAGYLEGASLTAETWRTAAVSGHPILPLQVIDLPEESGKTVRSVVPVAMTSDADGPVGPMAFARAGSDHALDPELVNSGDYPATQGHLMTLADGAGSLRSSLAVTPVQVHLEDGTPTPGDGRVRRFPRIEYQVLYGDPFTAVANDTIRSATAIHVPGPSPMTSYAIDVDPAPGAQTVQVYVLARPATQAPTGNQWIRTDLQQVDGAWVGGSPGLLGDYLVVAVNSLGFSAMSNLKGLFHQPIDVVTGGDFSALHFSAQPGSTGWYTDAHPIVTCDAGYTLYDNGEQVTCPYELSDGVHVLTLRKPDGTFVSIENPPGSGSFQPAVLLVLVDTIAPTLSVVLPDLPTIAADGNRRHAVLRTDQPLTYAATFGPSGGTVMDNGIPLPGGRGLDTATVGVKTLQVTATSLAGKSATYAQGYRVVYDPRSTGFRSPVVNAPGLNLTVRSLVYAFGYKLVDGNNAAVTSGAGSGNTAAFTSISCPSTNNTVQLPRITGATAQPVHTGNGVWLWDLSMPNPGLDVAVCRHLRITTNDGWTHFDADLQIAP